MRQQPRSAVEQMSIRWWVAVGCRADAKGIAGPGVLEPRPGRREVAAGLDGVGSGPGYHSPAVA